MASLESLRADALHALRELETRPRDASDFDSEVQTWTSYCWHLANAAYVSLLADADPAGFSLFLARAGANWRVLLERARRRNLVVPAYRLLPLLGVMATDDAATAAQIARLSARTRQEPEYEDEFFYAFALQELISSLVPGGPDRAQLRGVVDQLAAVASDSRAPVCAAILDADRGAFWPAVEALGHEYEARMEKQRSSPAGRYLAWRGARFVWLEGLALARIGARLGLGAPPGALPCLPPLAFQAAPVADDGAFLLARS